MILTVGGEYKSAAVRQPTGMGEVELEGVTAIVGQLQNLTPARCIDVPMLRVLVGCPDTQMSAHSWLWFVLCLLGTPGPPEPSGEGSWNALGFRERLFPSFKLLLPLTDRLPLPTNDIIATPLTDSCADRTRFPQRRINLADR